jgi:hypothetical protein
MYMRAALLALALGQASALLSSPPSDDKHASALSSPPSDDKHASALTSPPSDDKHASALSSPPNDDKLRDKFTVLRALDNAQLMAEVARRNLNACDGAPPQEHRALQEVHYSFKYECSCDPTPEPTHTSTSSTTAPPSPSPTVAPTVCDYKRIVFKESGKTYHECKDVCKGYGMQMPCIYDKHTDDALGKAMGAYPCEILFPRQPSSSPVDLPRRGSKPERRLDRIKAILEKRALREIEVELGRAL